MVAEVLGYENYLIYPHGEVWKKETQGFRYGKHFLIKAGFVATRISKLGKGIGGGYERVDLKDSTGKRKTFLMHRLVAEAYIPNPENLPDVNHINGDRSDNRVENLEWLSRSENQKHAYKTTRSDLADSSHFGKVSHEEALAIFEMRNTNKLPLKHIAEIFNIDFRSVSRIAKGGHSSTRGLINA